MNEIPASSVKNKKNTGASYTNLLFQNIQSYNFTQENFCVYQKNILNILDNIINNMHTISTNMTEININKDSHIQTSIKEIDVQCQLL